MKKEDILQIANFLFFSIFLCSCTTTHHVSYSQRNLDSFVGLTHQEIVAELGAPINEFSDGGYGYILVYEGNKELFEYSSSYANHSKTLPEAQFYMNPEGICQRVRADKTDSIKITSVGGTIALVLVLLVFLL